MGGITSDKYGWWDLLCEGWRDLDALDLAYTFRLKGTSWREGGFGGEATSTNSPPAFGIWD